MRINLVLCAACIALLMSFVNITNKDLAKKEATVTNLIIVRHAEKNNETDTSSLSTIGSDRANRLAQFLIHTELSAIYATPFVRMHLTAAPTAVQHHLKIQNYQPHDLKEIDKIIKTNLLRTVLIVGHSNTIPEILNHYTGASFELLNSYNDIFVVQISNTKGKSNSMLHFYY